MPSTVAPLLAVTATVALLPAAPGHAAPAARTAAQTAATGACYGTTTRSYIQPGGWGAQAGPYRTTSRCTDINVRNASSFGTQACVVFIERTSGCNYWTYLPANSSWLRIATNVRDGVRFNVRFANTYYRNEPLIAYHAF